MIILVYSVIVLLALASFITANLIKRNRIGTYLFLTIGLLLVLALIVNPFIKSATVKEEEQALVGNYFLDGQASTYNGKPLPAYAGIVLTISPDNTFHISKPIPYLKDTSGKWEYKDDGDISYTECTFGNDDQPIQVSAIPNKWVFSSEVPSGLPDDKIVFKR